MTNEQILKKAIEKFRDQRISNIVNGKADGNWDKLPPDEYKIADILTQLIKYLKKFL